MVAVLPVTEHTLVVDEKKLTGNPEVAVALNVIVAFKYCWAMVGKLIVCAVGVTGETVKLWVTGMAAVKLAFPGWLAAIEQVPGVSNDMLLPETVQTVCVSDVNVTGRPELAVALTAMGVAVNARFASAGKLMV